MVPMIPLDKSLSLTPLHHLDASATQPNHLLGLLADNPGSIDREVQLPDPIPFPEMVSISPLRSRIVGERRDV